MMMRNAGTQITSTLPAIVVSVFLFMMAVGLLNIFLSVRMSLDQVNAQVLGLVMAAYFAGLMAGSLYARYVVARVGHIRSFTAFAAVATISVILHGLLESLTIWALLRAITGFSLAGMYLVIESWLQEIATPRNRSRLFAVYMMSNYLGMAGGQLMLNLSDPLGIELVLVTALLFALCLIPIALTRAAHPAQIEIAHTDFMNFIRTAPFGSLGSFSSGMIVGAFLTLAPAWGIQHGLSTSQISVFMALAIIGGLMLQWPIGKLSDHYNRERVMMVLGLAVVLLPLGFLFNTGGLTVTLTSALLFGGIAYSVYPLSVCHANDQTPPGHFVMTATVMLLLYGIGAALGPLLAAMFMWAFGSGGLFLFIMATAAVFTVLVWYWYDRIRDLHQTPFMAVPRTTPLVPELDPRSDEDLMFAMEGSTEDQTSAMDNDDNNNDDTVQEIRI